jgi:hypothetical protein
MSIPGSGSRSEAKPANERKQVLFVGGDLRRKGGDIVYELARLEAFKNIDFHIVSPHAVPGHRRSSHALALRGSFAR